MVREIYDLSTRFADSGLEGIAQSLRNVAAEARKAGAPETFEPVYQHPDYIHYPERAEVTFQDGREVVKLTPTENNLLRRLEQTPNRVVNFKSLAKDVWNTELGNVRDQIKIYILRLRQKIEKNPRQSEIIETHRGIGYELVVEKPPDG